MKKRKVARANCSPHAEEAPGRASSEAVRLGMGMAHPAIEEVMLPDATVIVRADGRSGLWC